MMTQTRKPRPRPIRKARISKAVNGCHALQLTVGKKSCFYWLEPFPADRGSAFLLKKWEEYREEGEPDVYHVLVDGLLSSCECRGFLRHGMCKDGKGCKHIAGLAQLIAEGKLTPLPSTAAEAPALTTDFDSF